MPAKLKCVFHRWIIYDKATCVLADSHVYTTSVAAKHNAEEYKKRNPDSFPVVCQVEVPS